MIPVIANFPVSPQEWIAICAIQSYQPQQAPIMENVDVGLAEGFASALDSDEVIEFTDDEQRILDERLMDAHEHGQTSILDALTIGGVGNIKPNFTEEIIAFYTDHPGETASNGAKFLAQKFIKHFDSEERGMKKLYKQIHTLASSRTRKRLDRIGQGLSVGFVVSQ